MNLTDIEAFLAVVEHGGFSQAAKALFVSQPTVSRRVIRLERDLRVQLIRRTKSGIELTPRGAAFVVRSRRLLTMADEARSVMRGGRSDTIVLSCPSTAVVNYLTGFLPAWNIKHPGVLIHVIEDSPQRNLQHLIDHECDIAIVAGSLNRTLTGMTLARVGIQAVIPDDHPLSVERGPLDVRALDGQPILLTSDEFLAAQMLRAACRAAGSHPEIVFQSTIGHALALLARAGLGIAVLHSSVTLEASNLIRRPLTGPDGTLLCYDIIVAWDRERTLSPVLKAFVHELSEFTRAGSTVVS